MKKSLLSLLLLVFVSAAAQDQTPTTSVSAGGLETRASYCQTLMDSWAKLKVEISDQEVKVKAAHDFMQPFIISTEAAFIRLFGDSLNSELYIAWVNERKCLAMAEAAYSAALEKLKRLQSALEKVAQQIASNGCNFNFRNRSVLYERRTTTTLPQRRRGHRDF